MRLISSMLVGLCLALPNAALAWDLDLDGHPQQSDLHPCDDNKAGTVHVPARDDFGTLLLESDGDDDFNDAVVGYRFDVDVRSDLKVSEVRLVVVPRAVGDLSNTGLGWWLRVGTGTPVEVAVSVNDDTETFTTMTSTTIVNIDVFDNLRAAFGMQPGSIRTDETSSLTDTELQRHEITVRFSAPVWIELHDLQDGLHFREAAGPVAATGSMRTPSGLPRVLSLPTTTPFPREGISVFTAWPRLVRLVKHGGDEDLDFYLGPHATNATWGDDDPAVFEPQPNFDASCLSPCGPSEVECNAAFASAALDECDHLVDGAFDEAHLQPPDADSDTYQSPAFETLEELPVAMQALAEGAALPAAEIADSAGYTMCRSAAGDVVVLAPHRTGLGRAAFAWRVRGAGPVLVGAPHPQYELHTREEARRLFGELGLRVLVISGTHRCASTSETECSGETGVCGADDSPFRQSDMAHTTDSVYHLVHEIFADLFPNDVQVSLHGMSDDGISVSTGTDLTLDPQSPAARLATNLSQILPGERVTVCQPGTDVPVDQRLCGRTNVQGRALNGSTEACMVGAPLDAGRFVHLEQGLSVRQNLDAVVSAFAQTF